MAEQEWLLGKAIPHGHVYPTYLYLINLLFE